MNDSQKSLSVVDETILESLVLNGDLSKLRPDEKVKYYIAFCQRIGLDPATQPFKIMRLSGKETLYCDRGGAAQLKAKHKVSRTIVARETQGDCYVVTAQAKKPDGEVEDAIGVVAIEGLKGEARANAMMKAETKAKRRATLDLLGLGVLDESELGEWSAPGETVSPMNAPDNSRDTKPNAHRDEYLANPLDDSGSLPTRRIEPDEWKQTAIHFGKNKGEKLGALSEHQLNWYRVQWEPRPYNGRISENDTALRAALDNSIKENYDDAVLRSAFVNGLKEWAEKQGLDADLINEFEKVAGYGELDKATCEQLHYVWKRRDNILASAKEAQVKA